MDHLVCTLPSSTSCPLIHITSPLSKPDGAFSAKLPPKMLPGCGVVGVCGCRTVKARTVTHQPSAIKRRMRTFIDKRIAAYLFILWTF
jgi:hypothetical protein